MRVLVVTNMYPPHHFGGYELSCRDVIERFEQRGHDVVVLTTTFRRDDIGEGADTRDVRRELQWYWRDHGPWMPGGRETLRIERWDRRVFRSTVRDVRPDVLSLWNLGALPLSLVETAMATGLPIVHHTCNDWPALNLELDPLRSLVRRRPVAARVAATLLGVPTKLPDVGASGVFCWVSAATWAGAEAATPWRFARSVVVHSGISHDDFPVVDEPAAPRPWKGRLLFVGRVDGLKGVEAVIDAVSRVDGTSVDIVGPGDARYLASLRDRATRLGVADRVRFSTAARHDLRDHYLAADALLFTSLHEPFGLVPIEAMACGTPVVASGAGGSSEFLVDGRNSLLYDSGDTAALAAAIRRLASDDELRLALAREGLAVAREFSVDRLADRLERAHLDAIAHASAARGRIADGVPT